MSDQFLHDMRREPRPEFSGALSERLRAQGPATAAGRATHFARRFRPLLAAACALLVVGAFILSPSLRLQAQAFLDLFRVSNFTAVSIDTDRLAKLDRDDLDLEALFGHDVEKLEEPGPSQSFMDRRDASSAAGFRVRMPAVVPEKLASQDYEVNGAAAVRMKVDGRSVEELVKALGLTDVRIPKSLDGAEITVRTSPAVSVKYRSGDLGAALIQARSPEISAPAGLEIEQVGELALRIAGLAPRDAHHLAQRIDWRNTLVVPVPANATTFREVDLGRSSGLLITTKGAPAGSDVEGKHGNVLLWSEDGMVYGLVGNISGPDLVQMAMSLD